MLRGHPAFNILKLFVMMVISLSLMMLIPEMVRAEKLDITTHDVVIQKLEGALASLDGQPSEGRIKLRLADLYADRARLKSLTIDADGARQDRIKAIAYYNVALILVAEEEQARALLQIAHLYSLNGRGEKAKEVIDSIIKQKNQKLSPEVLQAVYATSAEMNFQNGRFDVAEKHIRLAQAHGNDSQFLRYRLSWCLMNRGENAAAKRLMVGILKSSEATDVSLKKDVSRDLATVLARETVTSEKINEFQSYSDKESKIDNFIFLGEECDRLDNQICSRLVWGALEKYKDLTKDTRLDIQLRGAQNDLKANQVQSAQAHYATFTHNLKANGCDDAAFCAELETRSRAFILNWIKKEKSNPSKALLSAILNFTQTHPDDSEMILWSGHIARELRNLKQALVSYRQAADASSNAIDKKSLVQQRKILSNALLLEIECAESLQIAEEMAKAYDHYISLNAKGPEVGKVKSQYAYLQRKQAIQFAIEKYKGGRAQESAIQEALDKLKSAPMLGATADEKVKIYKNQILLAEKLKDLTLVDSAAYQILQIKPLSADDREYALERRLWVAELRLDFTQALKIAQQSKLRDLDNEEKLLKIAVLTELAGRSAHADYRRYLRSAKNLEQANLVRGKLVRESAAPWSELKRQKAQLRKTPTIYNEIVFAVFAQSPSVKELKKVYEDGVVRRGPYGAVLARIIEAEEIRLLGKKIHNHRLFSQSESRLQKNIKERIALLRKANKMANSYAAQGDFTLRVLALNLAAKENQKFHDDLLRLPTPRGLKKQDRLIYQNTVAKKAEEFSQTATDVTLKIIEMFNKSTRYSALLKMSDQEFGAKRKMAAYELSLLLSASPEAKKSEIQSAINEALERSTARDILNAKKEVKEDPFDVARIQRLKELEMQRGSVTMVAFLEARINTIKRGQF